MIAPGSNLEKGRQSLKHMTEENFYQMQVDQSDLFVLVVPGYSPRLPVASKMVLLGLTATVKCAVLLSLCQKQSAVQRNVNIFSLKKSL